MIDAKQALTNGVWCPIPWTGFMYNHDGTVKNCIRSANPIGDIKTQSLDKILTQGTNLETQTRMLQDQPGSDCHPCYDLERGKKRLDIISDRIFYIRELKHVPFSTYEPGQHDLRTIDVRWSNLCNFACVYCSPDFSSRWSSELSKPILSPADQQIAEVKQYVFERAHQLQHVYMAGGEPLLIKENLELLELLARVNPDVNLRINTNLSKVDTRIFDKICEFKNVHWTVSVESMAQEFEYIRYGGRWSDFLDNLNQISTLDHKITFNMLWFLLNYRSLFDTIDFLQAQGFHANSFVIGALLEPCHLDVRHLPGSMLDQLRHILDQRILAAPGYLLQDSLINLRRYLDKDMNKSLRSSLAMIALMDRRRNQDSQEIFPDLYALAGSQGEQYPDTALVAITK